MLLRLSRVRLLRSPSMLGLGTVLAHQFTPWCLISAAPPAESGACPVSLAPYSAFHAALKAAFDNFLDAIRGECARMAVHHLEAATSPFGVHVTAPGSAAAYSGEGGSAFRERLLGGDSVLSDKSSGRRSVEETSDDENMPPPGAGERTQLLPGEAAKVGAREEGVQQKTVDVSNVVDKNRKKAGP